MLKRRRTCIAVATFLDCQLSAVILRVHHRIDIYINTTGEGTKGSLKNHFLCWNREGKKIKIKITTTSSTDNLAPNRLFAKHVSGAAGSTFL